MRPLIDPGTTLQSRYRVVRLLGQGGFGRTYLAEDTGRFNEACAIKELEPQTGPEAFSEKAMQLFQREAEILYQIQHPQIPQFRATFQENQRLFMVQDYVDGTTYRHLLNQRIQAGGGFSEAEVRQFLQHMLPVLAHIHSKGIIHRDISPDNIIHRQQDQLPVLIDFGVVKEVVTRIQMTGATLQATSVGKPGYSPSEQIQSGRAYPSSDLYSLAVTAMVLLTGREPQDLFDDVNLGWRWQSYANVSPGLAQVLNRAANYRPGDRYQSVSEMAQALGDPRHRPIQAAPPSQVRTVAVGRAPQATEYAPAAATSVAYEEDDSPSLWENPLALIVLGLGLALLAGLGGWGIVQVLNGQRQAQTPTDPPITLDPTPAPTPAPEPQPEPEPVPPPTAEPVEYEQRLPLRRGDSRTITGNLQANETINYILRANQGWQLSAQLGGEGVLMTVLAPNGELVDPGAQRVRGWQGTLPERGPYVLQLSPVQGLADSDYELAVSLEDAAPEPEPEPLPEPEPEPLPEPEPEPLPEPEPEPEPEPPSTLPPEVLEQRISIPGGQGSVQVPGQVGPERIRRLLVNAQAGQTLRVELPSVTGPVTIDVRYPDSQPVPGGMGVLVWEGNLSVGGDYQIDIRSSQSSQYTAVITLN